MAACAQQGRPGPPLFIRHAIASYVAGLVWFVSMFPFGHPFEESSLPITNSMLFAFLLLPLTMPIVLVVGVVYPLCVGVIPRWPLWLFYGLYFGVHVGVRYYYRHKTA